MRLIVISSFIISLLLIWCIVKQLSIIRIQRKTMQMLRDFTYAMDEKKETDYKSLLIDFKSHLTALLMGVKYLRSGKLDNKPEMRAKYLQIVEEQALKILQGIEESEKTR